MPNIIKYACCAKSAAVAWVVEPQLDMLCHSQCTKMLK